ncbi:MAG: DUF6624 domain-containing protein [Bacteroidia bacterium]
MNKVKIKSRITLVLIFVSHFVYCQYDTSKYEIIWTGTDSVLIEKPTKADGLRNAGDLRGAISELQKAISEDSSDNSKYYNTACLYSLLGSKDTAFMYLDKALKGDSGLYVVSDPDLYNLSLDKRWQKIQTNQLKKVEQRSGKKYEKPDLTLKLLNMKMKDQAYYYEMEVIRNKFGENSPKIDSIWKIKEAINEANQKEIESIIARYGWPKISVVGLNATSTAFLIIQHSDIKRQNKYLPLLKKACESNEAEWQDYALMKDRVLLGEGKKQLFGSQVKYNEKEKKYELSPLENPEEVDKRRMKMGLGPLKHYVSNWGIEFNVPQK